MECSRKRATNDSKGKAMIGFNRLIQNLVMSRKQRWHLVGMFLREFGAAFDICEEKGDGT
jgi:hypothetical protein